MFRCFHQFPASLYIRLKLMMSKRRRLHVRLRQDEVISSVIRKGAEIEYDREGFVGSFDLKYRLPPSPDAIIVTYGRITANAVMAAKMLSEAGGGYSVGIIKLVKIYPFDADEIIKLCCGAKLVYLLEGDEERRHS